MNCGKSYIKSYTKGFRCTKCNQFYAYEAHLMTCPKCGETGILDVEYDYKALSVILTKDHFLVNRDCSMWRYAHLMSIKPDCMRHMLRVGGTPLYKSHRLVKTLGITQLYFKDDSQNPTASLKDRASAVAVLKAIEGGYDTIACSSTGNAATSLAGNAARMGLKTVIYVPERIPEGKLAQLLIYGSRVIKVDGDYQEAFAQSKKAIEENGWYNRNAAINPHLVEGKKTVAFEIAEQLHWQVTDWVAVSVGDGCIMGSLYKGFSELFEIGLIHKIPKLLGVQSSGCSPIYDAWLNNTQIIPMKENTIADSISVGSPRNHIKALRAATKTEGAFITVDDDAILAGIKLLGQEEGVFGEPAGVTGFVGVQKAVATELIKSSESVTVIITGHGLKDVGHAMMAAQLK